MNDFHIVFLIFSYERCCLLTDIGRNRQLQGLAMAMVKLWERSAIAKIAIKRGVQNTCNERMAQELKVRIIEFAVFELKLIGNHFPSI